MSSNVKTKKTWGKGLTSFEREVTILPFLRLMKPCIIIFISALKLPRLYLVNCVFQSRITILCKYVKKLLTFPEELIAITPPWRPCVWLSKRQILYCLNQASSTCLVEQLILLQTMGADDGDDGVQGLEQKRNPGLKLFQVSVNVLSSDPC